MVEFAILIPFLFSIVMGGVDFGRVFGQNAAIYGAGREAARQAIVYSLVSNSNPNYGQDGTILCVAQGEMGEPCDNTAALQLAPPANVHNCSFTATSPPGPSMFPTTADSGYLFLCWYTDGNNVKRVRVTIAWTMSLITPFVQNMVGTPHLHAIVDASAQSFP
jgi:Flp pilus assembly protein TadG